MEQAIECERLFYMVKVTNVNMVEYREHKQKNLHIETCFQNHHVEIIWDGFQVSYSVLQQFHLSRGHVIVFENDEYWTEYGTLPVRK